MEWTKNPRVVAALLALAVAILLHGNLFGPFYRIDDVRYVPHSVEGSWKDLFKTKPGFVYAPVTYLSLRVDRKLFGPPTETVRPHLEHLKAGGSLETAPGSNWAWAPRLMNGVYHFMAGFFLWLFLVRVGAGHGIALLVSFVWTAHPAGLESIAWVCERKNVLCALFGFAALAAWAGDLNNRLRWVWVTLLMAMAMFSKASALSFLPVLFALELFDPRKSGSAWREPGFLKSLVARMGCIVVFAAVVVKLTVSVYQKDIAAPPGGTIWTGVLTDSEIFARYTVNTLLPFWLSFLQGVEPVRTLADVRFWLFCGVLAALWLGMFFASHKEERHWVLIGFLWFFGALGPNANLVASACPIQDRYTYIPMPGLLIAAVFAVRGILLRKNVAPNIPAAVGIGFAAFILAMGALRSPLFANSDLLMVDAAERQPQSGFAQLSRAWTYEVEITALTKPEANTDPRIVQQLSLMRASCLIQALKTNDFWNFSSPIAIHAQLAESLLFADRDNDVLSLTMPMLKTEAEMASPLKVEKVYPEMPPGFHFRFRPEVDRAMMGRAWLATGESLLKASYLKEASPEQRMIAAQKVVEHVGQTLAFLPDNTAALLLKGKALIRISYLSAATGAMPEALKAYEDARAAFAALPKDSARGKQAEMILKNVPPPEAPKVTPPSGAPNGGPPANPPATAP